MKKSIILSGITILMLSCNSARIEELETEIVELKTSMVLCQQEAQQQRTMAEMATLRAFEAQKIAEEQSQKLHDALAND